MPIIRPLDDLEMFELLSLAYPEKFKDESDVSWDAAQDFAADLQGFDDIADLLGRVVMLTIPMQSALTKKLYHCLGEVTIKNQAAQMRAAVNRDAE